MLTLPAGVEQLLTRSHGVSARLLASVNGSGFTYPVLMRDGRVTVNGSSPMRRTMSALIQADINDPEADTFVTEVRAEYGIVSINGAVDWIAAGTFVVVDANEEGRGRVRLTCEDRWRRIMNARFTAPRTTSGSIVATITTLLTEADSRITVVDESGSTATHGASVWERDRDKAILELAKSAGLVVVFDPNGVARIRSAPLLSDPVRWRLAGGDGGALIDARRGRTQRYTYNAAVVEGEASDGAPPVRSEARVTDGGSKIVFGGPFASKPRFYRSSLIRTKAQADAAVVGLLARVTGQARTLSVDAFPHPGLDADDVIDVQVAPDTWERHIVDKFDLPLEPDGVVIETRSTTEDMLGSES